MKNNLNHLAEVMITEAELTEQLAEVLKQQQQALVRLDSASVALSVDRQQELLLPIEGLEHERARLTREIWNTIVPDKELGDPFIALSTLLPRLAADDARFLDEAGSRLLAAALSIVQLNQANQYLIQHSRKFVQETFRIITNGYSRQLVDQKI